MHKIKFFSPIVVLTIFSFLVANCQIENDIMLPKDVAGYTIFKIEGQVSSVVSTESLTVTVTMPDSVKLNSLKVEEVEYTDVTFGKESLLAPGDVVDLSDTLKIRLFGYREFVWKLIARNAPPVVDPEPVVGPQLPNMGFDDWSMQGKGWFPHAENASLADIVWTTANEGTSGLIGKNTTEPEESFVAVPGPGKKAARLKSDYFLVKFAAGNLFTGEFCGLIGTKGADLAWGVPFTSRPKSLSGYYCYKPALIDYADATHADLKGKPDSGQIQVILADWDPSSDSRVDDKGRFHVKNSENQFVDPDNDPAIIGYGSMEFSEMMENYEMFDIPIKYKNDRTPKVVVIVAASSRYGDYFTGGKGTLLYLDEFAFKY